MLSAVSRVRRYIPRLSLALCLGATLLPCGANAQESDPLNPKMSAHFTNVTFQSALDLLFRASGFQFSLPPDLAAKIDPNQAVEINISDAGFQDALNSLLDQVNPPLAFHIENGKYVLESSPNPRPHWGRKPPKNTFHPNRVNIRAEQMPFEQAVHQLFFNARDTDYRIDPAVTAFLDPVTYTAADATLDDALTQLLNAVPGQKPPLTFHKDKNVYVITAGSHADRDNGDRPKPPIKAIGLPSYHPLPAIKNVAVVDIRPNVPLRLLFQQADADYVLMLPNSVAALPRVTFAMGNAPLEQAVVHLLRSTPADPMLDLSLIPTPPDPAETNITGDKSANGKQTPAKPDILYTVKPRLRDLTPLPLAGYRFTFRFQNANIYDALKGLLNGTGTSYSLDPSLRKIRAVVSGDDLTLDKAIDKLLAAAPKPLAWNTADNVFTVKYK